MNKKYDLTCEFDIEKHKKTFINYFEVIILPDGKVKYAVPSHQEFLIKYCMDKLQIQDRNEFYALCPREYQWDYLEWLCKESGCIALWDTHIVGKPNLVQLRTIKKLKLNGLYKEEK